MKKIFLLLTFILSYAVQSQDISPSPNAEYCPNEEYIFTISNVASYIGNTYVPPVVSSQSGVLYAQFVSFYGGTVTVRVRFSDNNNDQSFKLESASGNNVFTFRNVKSFFGGYSENNITSVNVPLCNTNPFTISLGGSYKHNNSFSVSNFGLITKFNYRIPAGWRINGQLSTGTPGNLGDNTFLFWGEVTITPDATTTGGAIWYQALSDCGQANFQGDAAGKYIAINRGIPTYTISPTSLKFTCGTPKTQTFTVTQTGTTTCPVSYTWNLGTNNGWLYNGTAAPASITTTTASITLTSANGNVLPSSITVTPKLGTTTMSSLSCTTSLAAFAPTVSINGATSLCSNSSTYTISGVLAGQTVTWSSSNTAVATISNPTNSSVTVNKVDAGSFNLIATILNPCGQTLTIPKPISTYVITSLPIPSGSFGVDFIDCYNDGPVPIDFFPNVPFGGVITYTPSLLPHPLQSQTKNITVKYTNPCTGEYTTKVIVFKYNAPDCRSAKMSNNNSLYKVYPNPSNDIVNIELKDQNNQPTKGTTIVGELFDMMGQSKTRVEIIDSKATFPVKGLNKGVYVLKITIDGQVENHQIVVE